MSQRALRFGIRNTVGLRAATWKLWTQSTDGKADVYLASRSLGGSLKASLHASGQWHVAYSQKTFEEKVREAIPEVRNRFIETWRRPPEIAPGITLALRIVTPFSAATTAFDASAFKQVIWIPNASEGRATEVNVFLLKPETPVIHWPGKLSMGSLIGSFSLENGETVWAVYHEVDMPDFSPIGGKGTGRFYKGSGKKDLETGNPRLLVFGTMPDGSRVMYDCAVQIQAN